MAHPPGSSAAEGLGMEESFTGDNELSSDEDSLHHGLEYGTWESGRDPLRSFGETLRNPEQAPMDVSNHDDGGDDEFDGDDDDDDDDDDDSMDGLGETESERCRRYLKDEMCRVSDPEYWSRLHYGPLNDSEDGNQQKF